MRNPATRLEVSRAVMDDASAINEFRLRTASDLTAKVLHTLSLNPEHTDRTVWVAGEGFAGAANWNFDGELRFWYLNKLQLSFPVQTLAPGGAYHRPFAVRFAAYEAVSAAFYGTGRQPCLEFILSGLANPLMAPPLSLRVRADRVELFSYQYTIVGGTMITGIAVLSCYP